MTIPLLEFKNIYLSFSEKPVFEDLDFKIFPGRHLALIGPNGSGKSSFLKLISGDLRLSQISCVKGRSNGKIIWAFGGKPEQSALAAKDKVRLLSPTLQEKYLQQKWNISGEEIILSGFYNSPMLYGKARPDELIKARKLAKNAGFEELLSMKAPEMSQGQLRAVLIMRTLISKPPLILLDEPFEGLDEKARKSLMPLLDEARNQGCTLVLTAHRAEDINPAYFNFITIKDSKIFELEPEKFPGFSNQTIEIKDAELDRLLTLHRRKSQEFIKPDQANIELKNVDVFINRKKILSNISWSLHKGENWIISGKNGAGKSTLLRLIHGEEFAAWGGTIRWFGQKTTSLETLSKNIGYVSDRLQSIYPYDISAEDLVLSGHDGSMGLYRDMADEEKKAAQIWMKQVKVLDLKNQNFRSLSTGQARRVLLARALASSPPVLLLDEPFSGLDQENREIWQILLPLLAENGTQIIMCSHRDKDKHKLFQHELLLADGKILKNSSLIA